MFYSFFQYGFLKNVYRHEFELLHLVIQNSIFSRKTCEFSLHLFGIQNKYLLDSQVHPSYDTSQDGEGLYICTCLQRHVLLHVPIDVGKSCEHEQHQRQAMNVVFLPKMCVCASDWEHLSSYKYKLYRLILTDLQ